MDKGSNLENEIIYSGPGGNPNTVGINSKYKFAIFCWGCSGSTPYGFSGTNCTVTEKVAKSWSVSSVTTAYVRYYYIDNIGTNATFTFNMGKPAQGGAVIIGFF